MNERHFCGSFVFALTGFDIVLSSGTTLYFARRFLCSYKTCYSVKRTTPVELTKAVMEKNALT